MIYAWQQHDRSDHVAAFSTLLQALNSSSQTLREFERPTDVREQVFLKWSSCIHRFTASMPREILKWNTVDMDAPMSAQLQEHYPTFILIHVFYSE